MHSEHSWFYESWINSIHNIIGFTLKPFSLHHLLHLTFLKSPILSFSPDSTLTDLEIACLVCTTGHGDNVNEIIDNHLKAPKTKRWRKELVKASKQEGYFVTECIKFSKYQKDYSTCAETVESFDTAGRDQEYVSVKIPWMLQYITLLMMKLNLSEKEAMDMPIGKVIAFVHTVNLLETGETKVLAESDMIAIKLAKGLIRLEDIMQG